MKPGFVRIIGGKWRGRRLQVPEIPGLRPTPDRVRETIFNWLMPVMANACCLDAFTGSGVLGFEALSRGAKHVVMVDQSHRLIALLKAEAIKLGAEEADIYCATIPTQLRSVMQPFNIVFLDPPYQSDLLLPTCYYLEEQGFLADRAYIYLEAEREITDNELPARWKIIKHKKAGHVVYQLAYRE